MEGRDKIDGPRRAPAKGIDIHLRRRVWNWGRGAERNQDRKRSQRANELQRTLPALLVLQNVDSLQDLTQKMRKMCDRSSSCRPKVRTDGSGNVLSLH